MKLVSILAFWSSVPCIVTAAPAEAKHFTSYSTSCSKSQSTSRSTSHSNTYITSRCTAHSTSTSKPKHQSTTASPTPSTTKPTGTPTSSTTKSTFNPSSSTTQSMVTTSSSITKSTATPTPISTQPTAPTATSVPYVDGRLFNIDGETQYFAGTNTWWLGHLFDDAEVENALSEIAATDLLVTRVWAFGNVNDPTGKEGIIYFQVLNETLSSNGSLINYNPTNGIERLDSAVANAEKYGIKLVLTLLNNWDDLGGINTYTNAFGGNSTTFYTDAKSQAAYRSYIEFIVNRYKSSCAIFAWELCNEPRCRTCDTSIIYNWASETSAFIKSIDPLHMVTLGDEGWFAPLDQGDGSYAYSGYEGVDFIKNLAIPTLDYGTFHLYPSSWGYNFTWGNEWIEQHNAAGKAAGKPVVLEEYGSPDQSNHTALTLQWQETVVNKTNVAYDSFWQFATNTQSVMNAVDNFALFYNTTLGSDYQVLAIQHAQDMLDKSPMANL